MSIVFSHISAARFWLLTPISHMDNARENKLTVPQLRSYDIESIPDLFHHTKKLHVLVPSVNSVHRSRSFQMHFHKNDLPHDAIVRLEDNLSVASPELTFLEMASIMDLYELVHFGLRLCGTYFPFKDDIGYRDPITSKTKIERFLGSMDGAKGLRNARKALRFICDSSASPRESITTMLTCLDTIDGGYGLFLPQLNKRIELSPFEMSLTGREHFRVDLLFESKKGRRKVGIEYYGRDSHSEPGKTDEDETRELVLKSKGISLHVIRNVQLENVVLFDMIIREVMRELGIKDWKTNAPDAEANLRLRNYLFGKNLWGSIS